MNKLFSPILNNNLYKINSNLTCTWDYAKYYLRKKTKNWLNIGEFNLYLSMIETTIFQCFVKIY